MKKKSKNKVSKTGIIVAVLLLAVGFAAVSTTLYINGTVNIGPNTENFEQYVQFADPAWDATSSTAGATASLASITTGGKTYQNKKITFTTHTFKTIGETATLSYKISNTSQYTAIPGNVTCTVTDHDTTDSVDATTYVTVTPTNGFNGTEIAPNTTTSTTDTIVVRMVKSYAGDTPIVADVACTLPVTAKVE